MIESIPVAAWTFVGGAFLVFGTWWFKHFLNSQKTHAANKQQLDDHLAECSERYGKMDSRMDNMGKKLDDVGHTASRAEGKLDVIIQTLNGNKPS